MNRPKSCLHGRSNSINIQPSTTKSFKMPIDRPRTKVGSRNIYNRSTANSVVEVPSLEQSIDFERLQTGGPSRQSSIVNIIADGEREKDSLVDDSFLRKESTIKNSDYNDIFN